MRPYVFRRPNLDAETQPTFNSSCNLHKNPSYKVNDRPIRPTQLRPAKWEGSERAPERPGHGAGSSRCQSHGSRVCLRPRTTEAPRHRPSTCRASECVSDKSTNGSRPCMDIATEFRSGWGPDRCRSGPHQHRDLLSQIKEVTRFRPGVPLPRQSTASIGGNVVNTIGHCPAQFFDDEVVHPDFLRSTVRPLGIQPLPPKQWSGRGRPTSAMRHDAELQPVSAKQLALDLPKKALRRITWRDGSNTKRLSFCCRACSLRTSRLSTFHIAPRGMVPDRMAGRRTRTDQVLSPLTSSDHKPPCPRGRYYTPRWRIERDYQDFNPDEALRVDIGDSSC